jgi:hypothetical protein
VKTIPVNLQYVTNCDPAKNLTIKIPGDTPGILTIKSNDGTFHDIVRFGYEGSFKVAGGHYESEDELVEAVD